MRLEHVGLALADPVGAAAWYGQHLGCETVRSSSEPPHAHFLRPRQGGALIEFFNNPAVADVDYWQVNPMQGHLAFAVEDVDAESAALVSAGATLDGPAATTPHGDRYQMLRDPWGVPLQLITRLVAFDQA